ncbi:MAG: S8 family serine peptidase [Bacteroidota bacterium]
MLQSSNHQSLTHRLFLLLLICCFAAPASTVGQTLKKAKYWVEFTDKKNTPYSLLQPWDYLSPRALDRRARQGIPITEQDLPVDPNYLQALTQEGATIATRSKWLNAAMIVADSLMMSKIANLPFVATTEYVGRHIEKRYFLRETNKNRDYRDDYPQVNGRYGYGTPQIQLLKGEKLHQLGFEGQGMLIAVLDGGFVNVDIMPFFDSLQAEGRLLMGRDFVDDDEYVYESSSHGSKVLSVMAADLPGLLTGTAPASSYVCIKTEDTRGEYLMEECNWVAGAEYADSLGADIINSSLGYTTFNDTSMNYTFEELDGLHSRASRAADIAFSKGMIVVNSAGNSGSDAWRTIGAPADAWDVVSVAATRYDGSKASFSSFGPSADGRIKPTVAAVGQQVMVASTYSYQIDISNGTSFASPTMAGAISALWSAFPDRSNQEIVAAVEQSASQYTAPNDSLGYGIPDFVKAYGLLKGERADSRALRATLVDDQVLLASDTLNREVELKIYDVLGRRLWDKTITLAAGVEGRVHLPLGLPVLYKVEVWVGERRYSLFAGDGVPKAERIRP